MGSPVRRNAVRATMPHVVTQWESGEWSRECIDARRAKSTSDYLRPIPVSRANKKSGGLSQRSKINLLRTPENDCWDFGSIRHIKQVSTELATPISDVESIFELPSNGSHHSPNSSAHSSFAAELEDTSPIAIQTKRLVLPASSSSLVVPAFPAPPKGLHLRDHSMEFKCNGNTPRAVIKVVDETIAAFEETNRKLLSRVVAAEDAAKFLREQNSQLQLKIKYCEQHHRPLTAPSQSVSDPQSQHRHTGSTDHETPLSSFNSAIDQLVLDKPKAKRKPRPAPPFPPLKNFSFTAPQPLSPASHIDLAPSPFNETEFKTASLKHMHSSSNILEISGPIPGSVMRHEVTYDGTPISCSPRPKNISLDEARRRLKPLPPLGPMSPSVVHGVVEIGLPNGLDELGTNPKESKGKRNGLSGLFKRSCRKGFV